MTQFTDTRSTDRKGFDSIHSVIKDKFGVVKVDSVQLYGPYTGESQTITSVRTKLTDTDPNWWTYSKGYKEHLLRQKKISKMLRRWHRKTNPNPCLIQKSVTKCSNDMSLQLLTGVTYPYCIISGNQAKWALCSKAGLLPWYNKPITRYEQNFIDNAVLKAFAKASSPSMPGLVYLGELGETIKMLRKPFSGIRTLFKKMRNHSRTRVRKRIISTASSVADQWLEYRYGIVPLMAQVDEICEAVAKRLLLGYPVKLTRDGLNLVERDTIDRFQNAKVSPTYSYGDYFYSEKVEIGAYCTLAHNLQMDEGKFFGLRPRDILPTAWELVPYSFVVDWIFNVGDWLQAIQPNPRLNVKSTSVSLKRETTRSLQLYNVGFGLNMYGKRSCNEHCTTTESRLDRFIQVPKPVIPVFNEDFFRFTRALDSAALGFGQLKRTFRALR